MLKADLKSTNSIWTSVFFFSRCSRDRWSAFDMASSMARFGDMQIEVGRVKGGGMEVIRPLTNLSNHFIIIGVSARAII